MAFEESVGNLFKQGTGEARQVLCCSLTILKGSRLLDQAVDQLGYSPYLPLIPRESSKSWDRGHDI